MKKQKHSTENPCEDCFLDTLYMSFSFSQGFCYLQGISLPPFSLSFDSLKLLSHSNPYINNNPLNKLKRHRERSSRDRKEKWLMEIKLETEESTHADEQRWPLLANREIPDPEQQTLIQKAISQTFQSTAHLANLLPTGSVLAFQLLSPIFTNQGQCDPVSRSLTAGLIALCGLSCFILCFTDSFRDGTGKVFCGFATYRGIWVIDGFGKIPPEVASRYRLRFIDFLHAFMSVMVFGAVALFNQDVVSCFYPKPSDQTKELLASLPVGVGVIGSMLFVVFPTERHGIGFPLSAH